MVVRVRGKVGLQSIGDRPHKLPSPRRIEETGGGGVNGSGFGIWVGVIGHTPGGQFFQD